MLKGTDPHNLMSPRICEMDNSSFFLTKGFLIRYLEEEVEINDVVLLRTEIDVQPGFL